MFFGCHDFLFTGLPWRTWRWIHLMDVPHIHIRTIINYHTKPCTTQCGFTLLHFVISIVHPSHISRRSIYCFTIIPQQNVIKPWKRSSPARATHSVLQRRVLPWLWRMIISYFNNMLRPRQNDRHIQTTFLNTFACTRIGEFQFKFLIMSFPEAQYAINTHRSI